MLTLSGTVLSALSRSYIFMYLSKLQAQHVSGSRVALELAEINNI
jgi:hypothetical protein